MAGLRRHVSRALAVLAPVGALVFLLLQDEPGAMLARLRGLGPVRSRGPGQTIGAPEPAAPTGLARAPGEAPRGRARGPGDGAASRLPDDGEATPSDRPSNGALDQQPEPAPNPPRALPAASCARVTISMDEALVPRGVPVWVRIARERVGAIDWCALPPDDPLLEKEPRIGPPRVQVRPSGRPWEEVWRHDRYHRNPGDRPDDYVDRTFPLRHWLPKGHPGGAAPGGVDDLPAHVSSVEKPDVKPPVLEWKYPLSGAAGRYQVKVVQRVEGEGDTLESNILDLEVVDPPAQDRAALDAVVALGLFAYHRLALPNKDVWRPNVARFLREHGRSLYAPYVRLAVEELASLDAEEKEREERLGDLRRLVEEHPQFPLLGRAFFRAGCLALNLPERRDEARQWFRRAEGSRNHHWADLARAELADMDRQDRDELRRKAGE